MNYREAKKLWKSKTFETYTSKMAGTTHRIESRNEGTDFCVSTYVGGSKVSEHWPEYRGGIGYRNDGSTYGEAFLAIT